MNVQHSTFNVQLRMKGQKVQKQAYDLEERLLEFSVRIIKVVEQLPTTRTGNHITNFVTSIKTADKKNKSQPVS